MNNVLYLIGSYPSDNAMTQHELAIADLLVDLGYDVTFAVTRPDSIVREHESWYEGYRFLSSSDLFFRSNKVFRYFERLTSRKSIHFCARTISELSPKIIIAYGASYFLSAWLKEASVNSPWPVIVDETDWFQPRFRIGLAGSAILALDQRRIKTLDPFFDGVISISPFLYSFFKKHGSNTMFLPPINRRNEEFKPPLNSERMDASDSIRLVYTGSLGGGKDLLEPVLEAIAEYYKRGGCSISLTVAGVSEQEAANMWGELAEHRAVKFLGRISHDESLDLVRQSDFGILLRRNELYARAGFSTKFSECMRNGVAMICNRVGGADTMLASWKDGVVLDKPCKEEIIQTFVKLEELGSSGIQQMKTEAYKTAQSLFSRDMYRESLEELINSARNLKQRSNGYSEPSNEGGD